MTDTWCVVILEKNSEGLIFARIPDFAGVNASGATKAEALALVTEFAADYVRDLVNDGQPVPAAREIDDIEVDPNAPELGRALIPVDEPGRSVKISLSIDEALLKRVDRAAARVGTSRSGFFAAAVEARLASAASSMVTAAAASRVRMKLRAEEAALGEDHILVVPSMAALDEDKGRKRIHLLRDRWEPVFGESKTQIIKGDSILKAFADANFFVPILPDEEDEREVGQ